MEDKEIVRSCEHPKRDDSVQKTLCRRDSEKTLCRRDSEKTLCRRDSKNIVHERLRKNIVQEILKKHCAGDTQKTLCRRDSEKTLCRRDSEKTLCRRDSESFLQSLHVRNNLHDNLKVLPNNFQPVNNGRDEKLTTSYTSLPSSVPPGNSHMPKNIIRIDCDDFTTIRAIFKKLSQAPFENKEDQRLEQKKDGTKYSHHGQKRRRGKSIRSDKGHKIVAFTFSNVYSNGDPMQRFKNQLLEGIRQVQQIYFDKGDHLFDDELTRKRSMEYVAIAAAFLKQSNLYQVGVFQRLYECSPSERPYHEIYRLASFAPLPDMKVSLIRLAWGGFYYDEAKDRIICFSCGLCKRDWLERHVSWRHIQLSPTCQQAVRGDSRDVPLNPSRKASDAAFSYQLSASRRANNDCRDPRHPAQSSSTNQQSVPVSAADGALAGFPVQADDDAADRRDFQDFDAEPWDVSGLVSATDSALAGFPVQAAADAADRRDFQDFDAEPWDISGLNKENAVSHEFATCQARRDSFASWPMGDLPNPRDLAYAGFYYTGVANEVRCFYCGVTSKNGQGSDDVWETHVRIQFSCDYVKAIKGENYVRQTLIRLSAGSSSTGSNNGTQTQQAQTPEAQSLTPNSSSSAAVSRETNIPRSQSAQRIEHQSMSPSAADAQASQPCPTTSLELRTPRCSNRVSNSVNDRRLCRMCRQRIADTTFLPCDHLCTCEECAATIRDCCICGQFIRARAHVFLE